MISYQWSNQKIALQIREFLIDSGYEVWIDKINMQGSLIESIPDAIENSSLVIICYSEKYKNSPYCRMEAEYVLNCRKKFLPVRMVKDYKPDGWLGFVIGAKLYYDFSEINIPGHLKKFLTDINDTSTNLKIL